MISLLPLLLLAIPFTTAQNSTNTYDYIVVGSGPGGGPLAANLARHGHSVLLVEAGDDQGSNLNETVPAFSNFASNDETMRWDFFVSYHSDENVTDRYRHMTWRQPNGEFWVGPKGPEVPDGSKRLGVYYPRSGTLGGCSTHNAMASVLGADRDWGVIAELTGDRSWDPDNMRQYFVKVENNHYLPRNTTGHGFDGYLDLRLNSPDVLTNQSNAMTMLQATAKFFGQDSDNVLDLVQRDLNNNNANRDKQVGVFGFPAHYDMKGVRVSARNPVMSVVDATNADGSPKYKLKLQLSSLVTKILFDSSTVGVAGKKPRAIGVEWLEGNSLYSADPRSNRFTRGSIGRAYARREVIVSGGTFNSPQLLKLSGIGPKDELARFNISLIADLPGVGTNLQDNYEIGVIARASSDFVSTSPKCTFGAPGDPCLDLWRQGKGPYVRGPLDSIMYKSSKARFGERDLFIWGDAYAFRGFWPLSAFQSYSPPDPASTWGFSMAKIHPSSRLGTVLLRSANPRDTPEINFRFFEDADGEKDIAAMAEGIEFGRKIFDSIGTPLGKFTESDPCNGTRSCDIKDWIKTQAWSHHATGSCAIGGDNDTMAVLDSKFRVRGVENLRVVDASAFPRQPGAFPVLPTFILSEKAAAVILGGDNGLKVRRGKGAHRNVHYVPRSLSAFPGGISSLV